MDLVFEKYQVEQYSFHGKSGLWALISVDEKRNNLSINSDYGDWSYRWTAPGMPFKQFLVQLGKDWDYLVGKLSRGEHDWDRDATEAAFRKAICCKRRKHPRIVPKELAREAFDEGYADLMDSSTDNEAYFRLSSRGTVISVLDWEELHDVIRRTPPVMVTEFVQKIYIPLFVPALQKELDEVAGQVA